MTPHRIPFDLKVEDNTVVGDWDYHAVVKFTEDEIVQLDDPARKLISFDNTAGRDATSTFAALSAATATTALKAIGERTDKLSTVYVPAGTVHNFAKVRQLAAISDCDDDDTILLPDHPSAAGEYVAHRPSALAPFAARWPRGIAERPLPAIAVSFDEGVATIVLERNTAELSEETKAAIVAADMQRVFIDACGFKPVDYPQEALAFLFRSATLVCAMALDCSDTGPKDDIAAAHTIFDARAEHSRWVVRLFTNSLREWGQFIKKHRPVGQHCLAWPTYDPEPAPS